MIAQKIEKSYEVKTFIYEYDLKYYLDGLKDKGFYNILSVSTNIQPQVRSADFSFMAAIVVEFIKVTNEEIPDADDSRS